MRIRIVMSGIFAGAICISALWLPWYMELPAEFTSEWKYFDLAQNFPVWLETGIFVFCGVALFAFGWTAARWNWEKNWRDSLLAGGEMGLIAGCLVYDYIGAFHYGMLGQKEPLSFFYVELTEAHGLTMMANAIFNSAAYMLQSFFVLIGASILIGAVGGLASAFDVEDLWGSAPRIPEQWLFRISAYTLTVSGFVFYIFTLDLVKILQDMTLKMVNENNSQQIDPLSYWIFIKFQIVAMTLAYFPLGITWGWIVRAWRGARLWRIFYLIWIAATLFAAGRYFIYYFQLGNVTYSFTANFQLAFYELILASCALLAGVTLGIFSGSVTLADAKYSFSDWAGYWLSLGIIGGTQLFASFPAYALALTVVTAANIPHLINTGLSNESIADQIRHLWQYLSLLACSGIFLCMLGGIFVGGLITLARKFLRIAPPALPSDAPVFMD